jgi:tetratricopeptide (TPR) repeat protein
LAAVIALVLAVLLSASPGPTKPPDTGESARETRKLYLRARTELAEGRFREALDLYRRVIERLPEDAVVRYEYAQLLRDLNVGDEAVAQAREAVRLDPRMAEAHRLLGSLELAAGEKDPARVDRAISELSIARQLAPGDAATGAALARALLARGRSAEAAQVLDELPESKAQTGLMRLRAEAKARSGKSAEAEALYKSLIEADPSDRESIAALIDIYEDQDRLDEALALLRDLEKKDPENPAVAERIAMDLARAGRFDEAEKRARELAAKRPENHGNLRLLAQVLFEKGDVAGGEKILRSLIASDPTDDASRRVLASEFLRDRRFDDARTLLEESLRRSGTDPRAAEQRQSISVDLGYLAFLQKDYALARRTLEPLQITNGAVNARASRLLLAAARDGEDFPYGLARARAAATAEPENAEWMAAVAEFQWRTGDKKGAEAGIARLAASGEPERALAAADVWARLKEFGRAANVARDLVRRFPDSTDALFRLGSSLERAGSPAEAEEVFLRLLRKKPEDAATLNYLGYMWADRNEKLDRAREMLEKAVAREPRNGAYLDSLGWVYFRLGRLEAAAKNLSEAHRRDPEDATIEEHLGDLAERTGKNEEAIAHWERALTLKPDEPEKVRQKIQSARPRASSSR